MIIRWLLLAKDKEIEGLALAFSFWVQEKLDDTFYSVQVGDSWSEVMVREQKSIVMLLLKVNELPMARIIYFTLFSTLLLVLPVT